MTTPTRPVAAHEATSSDALVRRALEVLDLARRAATAYDRADLADRLSEARERLVDPTVRVLVVGEFKQGKSSLINALVNAPVCPVDDDVATSAPTVIAHGEPARAQVTRDGESGELETEQIDLDRLAEYVSEAGNPANIQRIRQVDVVLPRKLLASGLALVDTPGVGGLGSVHSAITMAALPTADALLFVTDASQELTAPEIAFLQRALERCPTAAGVLTKTDLYPQWRRMVEIDRGRLADAGVQLELIPTSSALRQLALRREDRTLNDESGFAELVGFLRNEVVARSQGVAAHNAMHIVSSVSDQLASTFRAEREVLADPERAAAIVAELEQTRAKAEELQGRASRWQVTLNDGVADLNADADHDLRERTRVLLREVDAHLAENDPRDIWAEFEPWLYQRVAEDVAANATYTNDLIEALARDIAELFRADEEELEITEVAHPGSSTRAAIDRIEVDAEVDLAPDENVFMKSLTALRGGYGGVLMFGMIGGMAGLAMMNPLTIGIGFVMGRKTLQDEKKRQLATRRQQANQAVRKYVDEVQFQVNKDLREALRFVQRELRDTYQARADELRRTTAESLEAAKQAASSSDRDRTQRLSDVEAELSRIEALTRKADDVVSEARR